MQQTARKPWNIVSTENCRVSTSTTRDDTLVISHQPSVITSTNSSAWCGTNSTQLHPWRAYIELHVPIVHHSQHSTTYTSTVGDGHTKAHVFATWSIALVGTSRAGIARLDGRRELCGLSSGGDVLFKQHHPLAVPQSSMTASTSRLGCGPTGKLNESPKFDGQHVFSVEVDRSSRSDTAYIRATTRERHMFECTANDLQRLTFVVVQYEIVGDCMTSDTVRLVCLDRLQVNIVNMIIPSTTILPTITHILQPDFQFSVITERDIQEAHAKGQTCMKDHELLHSRQIWCADKLLDWIALSKIPISDAESTLGRTPDTRSNALCLPIDGDCLPEYYSFQRSYYSICALIQLVRDKLRTSSDYQQEPHNTNVYVIFPLTDDDVADTSKISTNVPWFEEITPSDEEWQTIRARHVTWCGRLTGDDATSLPCPPAINDQQSIVVRIPYALSHTIWTSHMTTLIHQASHVSSCDTVCCDGDLDEELSLGMAPYTLHIFVQCARTDWSTLLTPLFSSLQATIPPTRMRWQLSIFSDCATTPHDVDYIPETTMLSYLKHTFPTVSFRLVALPAGQTSNKTLERIRTEVHTSSSSLFLWLPVTSVQISGDRSFPYAKHVMAHRRDSKAIRTRANFLDDLEKLTDK